MIAERGNKVIRIQPSDASHYLNLGYDIKDDDYNLIHKAIPTDVGALTVAYIQHEKEIAELKAEIEKLKSKKSAESTVEYKATAKRTRTKAE